MRVASFLFSLLLMINIPSAFAVSSSQPEQCPSISALKSVGVHDAQIQQSTWIAFSTNNFSTPQQWMFAISSDQEIKDKNDAIKKANENIGLLSLVNGPYSVSQNEWVCEYEYNDEQKDVIAMSITPPFPIGALFFNKIVQAKPDLR